jgi:hypothetical protein
VSDYRPAYLDAVTVLKRSRRGDTYHRASCSRAKNGLPWLWAEGRVRTEVEAVPWLHPCKTCDPLGALPESVTP